MRWAPLIETPAVDKVTMGSRVCEAEQRGSIQNVLCKDRVEKLCSQLNRKIREAEEGERGRAREGERTWNLELSRHNLFLTVVWGFLSRVLAGQILQIARGVFLTFQQHTQICAVSLFRPLGFHLNGLICARFPKDVESKKRTGSHTECGGYCAVAWAGGECCSWSRDWSRGALSLSSSESISQNDQLLSLQLLLFSADAFIFQSQPWIFQGWVTDLVKNEKTEAWRRRRGGRSRGRGRGRGPEWYTGNQICFLRGSHKGPSDFNQAASLLALFIDFIGGRSNCVLSPCVSVCYLTSLWLTPPPSFFSSFFTPQHRNSNQHFETCCGKKKWQICKTWPMSVRSWRMEESIWPQ